MKSFFYKNKSNNILFKLKYETKNINFHEYLKLIEMNNCNNHLYPILYFHFKRFGDDNELLNKMINKVGRKVFKFEKTNFHFNRIKYEIILQNHYVFEFYTIYK